MNNVAFFHCYAGGNWQEPANEYLEALETSGLHTNLDALYIGLVGDPGQRDEARGFFRDFSPVTQTHIRAEADTGWEQLTLHALVNHFAVQGEKTNVVYAHTKGAWDGSDINVAWRRSMLHDVIGRWAECVELLTTYDAVGPHRIHPPHGGGYFGGNFWWATGRHIRLQPPLNWESRHHAEGWIADRSAANLFDLRPGWPGFTVFHKED